MRVVVLALIITGLCKYSGGQTAFQAVYGGANVDVANSVQQTSDNGYLLAGWTKSYGIGGSDFYLIKVDSIGNVQWSKTIGGPSDEGITCIQNTSDNGFILAGGTNSFGAPGDIYLVKIDSNGIVQWSKNYGGIDIELANSVMQTTDNGYIIAGFVQSGPGYDILLLKTDSIGNLQWYKTYLGSYNEWLSTVQQTSDGGYMMVGSVSSLSTGINDFYLLKADSSGNILWSKTFGGIDPDYAYYGQQTADGGYMLAGTTSSFGAGGYDIYLVKTDSVGNLLWSKTYGETGTDLLYSAQQTTDGGYILAGVTVNFGGGGCYLIKTDSAGTVQWSKIFGGDSSEVCYSVRQTADGGFVLTGITNSFGSGGFDMYLVKTDSNGHSGSSCNEDTAYTIVTIPATLDSTYGNLTAITTTVGNPSDSLTQAATVNSALCCLTADFTYSITCFGDTTRFIDLSVGDNLTWYWDYGDGSKDTFTITTNPVHYYSFIGTYTVTLIITNSFTPLCSDTLTQSLIFYPNPSVDLGNDTTICFGASILLDAGNSGAKYTWSTAETTQIITVTNNNTYVVIVESNFGCKTEDSIIIFIEPLPDINLGEDTTICNGETILLDAGNIGASFIWSTGDTTPTIEASIPGIYHVKVAGKTGCASSDTINIINDCGESECESQIFIPNAFTPNGDNLNDVLFVMGDNIDLVRFIVYDRWGEKVFETSNIDQGWDGRFNGQLLNPAVFAYYLEAVCPGNELIIRQGDITLIR
ncbi:MAG: gliding motility-associated C-terminal domain-containing protein [Bacteroidetes bacterium]|nr:gliding motility-associated C-terminal domain-containing protein [Bacteroidota bacterium]